MMAKCFIRLIHSNNLGFIQLKELAQDHQINNVAIKLTKYVTKYLSK